MFARSCKFRGGRGEAGKGRGTVFGRNEYVERDLRDRQGCEVFFIPWPSNATGYRVIVLAVKL